MVVKENILVGKTRTKRAYCSFYTDSHPILTYMVKRLAIQARDIILEPCAGDGAFVDRIFSEQPNTEFTLHAIDINPKAVENLKAKFSDQNIEIRQADALFDPTLDLFSTMGGFYTKVIGNPPYGAWQDLEKRQNLKKRYGGYVRETYTLFLRRCLDLLKPEGRLVFIVPDTFLALHLHKELRKYLLEKTTILEILLIPSSFFPGVNFGYSNLCIITLSKSPHPRNHRIKIVTITSQVENLYQVADSDYGTATNCQCVSQTSILKSLDHSFFIGADSQTRSLVNKATTTLGDLANCVTGFYSGDNRRFLVVSDNGNPKASGYNVVGRELIDFDFLHRSDLLSGLTNGKKYIPILKGSNGVFMNHSEWYVRWDSETVAFYKRDKRARFQNSQYYFKDGIGVPMVKSSRLRAFLLDRRIFDQSIVGIFPKHTKDLHFLLAFLNSSACIRLLKIINHTANNSANYMKKLPIIVDTASRRRIQTILSKFWQDHDANSCLQSIDEVFDRLYGF